jgi:hypothetical protein
MHSAHTQACRRACLAHDGGVAIPQGGPLEKVPWESAGKRMPFARVALFARVVVVASFKAPLLHSLPPRSSIAPALVRMASDKSFRNPHNLPVKDCVVCDRCAPSTAMTPHHRRTSRLSITAAARPHGHTATTATRSLALRLRLSQGLSLIRPFTWRKKWENCWDEVRHVHLERRL